jgi:hypothetical protein
MEHQTYMVVFYQFELFHRNIIIDIFSQIINIEIPNYCLSTSIYGV